MKKTSKIFSALMIAIMLCVVSTNVFATTIGGVSINPSTSSAGQVQDIGNSILGIIQVIGTVVAVGILMVLGIKYMMGSAEEKAEYKKTMIPYLIGAILLFAAVNIAGMLVNVANTIK